MGNSDGADHRPADHTPADHRPVGGAGTGEGTQPGELRLRPPVHRVNRRAVACWRTKILAPAGAVVVVLLVLALALPEVSRFWLVSAAAVLAVVGAAAGVGMPLWWYRVHRWEVNDDAVYTRTGALWQEWRVAPMSRIQTVDSERGPFDRAFGLATVTVTTASAKGAVTIPGLDHRLAADLVRDLTETTQANPGDAT